jgi:integrase
MQLTEASIKALRLEPGVTEKTYFDDALPAFGVRIRRSGAKFYVIQYKAAGGRKNRRLPLGKVGTISLAKVRNIAKDKLAEIRLGGDPVGDKLAERGRAAESFGAFLPEYLEVKRAELKPRSMVEIVRFLESYAKNLHSRPAASIDRRTIAIELTRIANKHGGGASNRFRVALNGYFDWLLRKGIVEANVVLNTNKSPEAGARDRVLTGRELKAIHTVTGTGDQFDSIVRVMVYTGLRRDEVGGLCWSEVNFDNAVITLPPARTKNSREHRVPMVPAVVEILSKQPRRQSTNGEPRDQIFGFGQRGYSGWSKSQRELNERLAEAGTPIANWWLHDIRRSMSTTMHEHLNIQPHIVEACLGHISGHLAGVAGRYNKSTYETQKRHALTAWADHIAAVISGEAPAPNVAELAQYRK